MHALFILLLRWVVLCVSMLSHEQRGDQAQLFEYNHWFVVVLLDLSGLVGHAFNLSPAANPRTLNCH